MQMTEKQCEIIDKLCNYLQGLKTNKLSDLKTYELIRHLSRTTAERITGKVRGKKFEESKSTLKALLSDTYNMIKTIK